jgi:hypothetical protein
MYQVLLRPTKLGTRDRWMGPDPEPVDHFEEYRQTGNTVQEGGKPEAGRAVLEALPSGHKQA